MQRVERWVTEYPRRFARFRDADGRPPRHSFFYPLEMYVESEVDGIADCVRRFNDAGVQVKDLDEGLLDFPARRGQEEVLLCWKVGEPEIAFWHGLDEGFAGRKPLD